MGMYRIQLTLWPYSGVERAPAKHHDERERSMRGAESPSIFVKAEGFCDAVRLANVIRLGAQLDERIWRANVAAVVQVDDTHRETELMTECAYR